MWCGPGLEDPVENEVYKAGNIRQKARSCIGLAEWIEF